MLKKAILIYLFVVLSGFSPPVQSEAGEYDLKAAYICNITKFIYWDTQLGGEEFVIGVIQPSPIYRSLTEAVKNKKVNEKKIVVKNYATLDEIDECHILFIPADNPMPLKKILARAREKKILTISEQPGYGALGTAINFITVNDKLRFEVNIRTLDAIGLKASAQFLKLAVLIE